MGSESKSWIQIEDRNLWAPGTQLIVSYFPCPGPDGIPYAAWRWLGDLAIDVLHDAFSDFSSDDFEANIVTEYPDFNEILFIFLPKKAMGATAEGDAFFEPGGVRPLNITNADNRPLDSSCGIPL